MGENAQKIGKKLEELGFDILSVFNWSKKMSDKEIVCKKNAHKNEEGKKKETHGIDMYLEYEDPYIGKTQGVFIECKNRNWDGITKSKLQTWVNEEINLLECAVNNGELSEYYAENSDRNCALILVNCNDRKFNEAKFNEYLEQLSVPSKRTPYKIFIAGNNMLNRWDAIDHMIKENYASGIEVIYPSINNSKPTNAKYWSINQLFSKYIFCQTEDIIEEANNNERVMKYKKKLVVFFFDKICPESFDYLWSMCRFFQYENSHYKFDICFWTENAKDHDYIRDNFLNRIRNYDDKVDNDIANKITVRYLLNRNVGAIDNR